MNDELPEYAKRSYPHDIEVELHFLAAERGGRNAPAFTGYRPQFFYNGADWDAVHTYPGVSIVNPGDTVRAYLGFLSPNEHLGHISVGMPFLIREGSRIIAYGKVTRIVDLAESAQKSQGWASSGPA